MTDADAEALGRRLIACQHFRAMRGMRDMQGRTWTPDLLWRWTPGVDVPDLRDPATRGCVLELVRVAFGCGLLGVAYDYEVGEWVVRLWNATVLRDGFGATEEEALVAALENAE